MLLGFMEVSPVTPPLPLSFASLLGVGGISFELDIDISSYLDVGSNLATEEMLPTQK